MAKLPSSVQLQSYSRDTRLLFRLFIAICVVFTIVAYFSVGTLPELFPDHKAQLGNAGHLIEQGLVDKSWGEVFHGLHFFKIGGGHPVIWSLTFLLTALWFTILAKITFNTFSLRTFIFGTVAILLGFLSTAVTLVSAIWHTDIQGFSPGIDRIQNLWFYIASVGFREETIKLIFFLPLTPLLYRTRNPALILFTASCIGLGFAAQENTIYLGASTLSRCVTANFLHIALTGTLGYAFCRFLYTPKKEWDRLIATYLGVIFIHGLYDHLATGGEGASIFVIIVFAYTCYYFFDLVAKHCNAKRQPISPLAVFTLGCAIIFGSSFVALATGVPTFHIAVTSAAPDLLGSATLMFIYINRLRDA